MSRKPSRIPSDRFQDTRSSLSSSQFASHRAKPDPLGATQTDQLNPEIVILTGERGAGKSTVCSKAVSQAQARGYACGGIITLSRPNTTSVDGLRDVLDARSGAVRRLTTDREPDSPGCSETIVQGRFRFSAQTLAWANDVLTRATPCHLLVIDELGPLELRRGGGWQKAFDVLHRDDYWLALVVVRPELVSQAQRRLPHGNRTFSILTVSEQNRDGLPAAIIDRLSRR